jgi:peptidyl-prolyl cis-trans isomerase B (cyclophilin B)
MPNLIGTHLFRKSLMPILIGAHPSTKSDVKLPRCRDVKERLVAYQGKLVKVQDALGEVPNGTGFTITTAASPQLDSTNLVVGRVVEGMDLVAEIASLPAVKANTNSAFFQ